MWVLSDTHLQEWILSSNHAGPCFSVSDQCLRVNLGILPSSYGRGFSCSVFVCEPWENIWKFCLSRCGWVSLTPSFVLTPTVRMRLCFVLLLTPPLTH